MDKFDVLVAELRELADHIEKTRPIALELTDICGRVGDLIPGEPVPEGLVNRARDVIDKVDKLEY